MQIDFEDGSYIKVLKTEDGGVIISMVGIIGFNKTTSIKSFLTKDQKENLVSFLS